MIPFLDMKSVYAELKPELDAAYHRVMESGWFVLGKEVEAFEAEYAAFCGTKHCVGLANGLEALELVLRAWDLGPGDEVIVPSNTYIATWLAISAVGATIVPVEPTPGGPNIDPDRIAAAITPRTKAIMPVHLYGEPADMEAIGALAARHGLKVVEDVAQAQGAKVRGRRTGALGDAGAHSFFPSKNIGAFGDGGAVTTDDDALAERLRVLRNYGSRVKYVNLERGYNSRLDEMQAAFLRVRLAKLDEWNERRRLVAARYDDKLAGIAGLGLPRVPQWAEPVWHLYVVRTKRRADLVKALEKRGIGSLIHYPIPPHLQQAYAELGLPKGSYPLAEELAEAVLSLPMGPHMPLDAVDEVANVIRETLTG
ncbi:MAG: DegT/DnrJ/EryC1/StrS family aminotransferase [Reyranella sp.]|jgi:dTDP-4-amino-4,6-dideoxygalactose transaminase|uniref:DegT/DnrJ/EryC1/StrS family aminotransferase n=1 Tax=Reyranella sp. TaxID=1929291 RepID=UPI0025E4B57C|nr:DegT/DnrJ/EryC1/StrS family aminotransferase [Reyranella sp.]MBR2816650.1 DegT/DnrJ/EryC1/StrS family aminotransferase [Reyranella sp.]